MYLGHRDRCLYAPNPWSRQPLSHHASFSGNESGVMSEVSSPREPMQGRPDFWSPTTIDKLAILRQSGASTVDIGRRLGASKNAVVGKAHRQFDLGDIRFTPRRSPIKPSSGNYDLISHHLKKGA